MKFGKGLLGAALLVAGLVQPAWANLTLIENIELRVTGDNRVQVISPGSNPATIRTTDTLTGCANFSFGWRRGESGVIQVLRYQDASLQPLIEVFESVCQLINSRTSSSRVGSASIVPTDFKAPDFRSGYPLGTSPFLETFATLGINNAFQAAGQITIDPLFPNVSLGPQPLPDLSEGGSLDVEVRLDTPFASTVSVAWSLSGRGSNPTIPEDFSGPTSGLVTFAPGDTLQTVTVNAANDDIVKGDRTFSFVLSNPTQAILPTTPSLNGVLVEDDTAGITIAPTAGLITTEAGGSDSFDVVLASEPLEDVSVDVASDTPAEGTVDVATLVFTAANWDAPQTVTVTGQPDQLIDPDVLYSIVLDPSVSADPGYSGIDPDDVSVTNLNTDFCVPVSISCSVGGPMTISGDPSCVVDVYDGRGGPNDPGAWNLVFEGLGLAPDGVATVPGLTCQSNITYIVTPTNGTEVLGSFLIRIVPTLGALGLLLLSALLVLVAFVQFRRRTPPLGH